MPEKTITTPEIILFDLGGVLVDVAPVQTMADSPDDLPDEETIDRLIVDVPEVLGFENGDVDEAEFSRVAVEAFDLPWPPAEFMRRYAGLITGPCPGTEAYVDGLAGRYRLCCLSNTNPVHWHRAREVTSACRHFERAYLSYELKLMKPDPAIYRAVINDLKIDPELILFFDDRPENVVAAREQGMQAVEVHNLEDMDQALKT